MILVQFIDLSSGKCGNNSISAPTVIYSSNSETIVSESGVRILNGKRKSKRQAGIVLLRIFTGILLLLSFAVVGGGVYIGSHFAVSLPDAFLDVRSTGIPPVLTAYRFSDRFNRIGTEEILSDGVPQAREGGSVSYGDLPEALIHAFVAIEDRRFAEHRGVDWIRTAAACLSYLRSGESAFGASTITQQTVKNLTGDSEPTLRRKLQEILYARDMERRLDKSEIMELYVNIIPFANGCIGVGQAAEFYYQKKPADLTTAECAAIAAITNNPTYYNPLTHPEHTLERRNLILSEMFAQGYLSETEHETALAAPLGLAERTKTGTGSVYSWYTDMVLEDVIADLAEKEGISRAAASAKVFGGGLRIETAMDPEVQKIVEDYYRNEVHTPQNGKGESAQSAMIVIDSRTGDILAVAGAVGEKSANRIQNFATQTRRPPGSAIKPLSVYAPALAEGKITWGSVYDDVPVRFGKDGTTPWPKNATNVYRGLTDIPYAVAHSTNTVALRVLEDVGLRNSYRWAKEKFHLESLIDRAGETDCDLAALGLGQLHYGVTLRELTAAYTVFADAGVYHRPRSYYRVTDADGTVLLSCPDSGERVLSAANAAVMTKLLEGVVRDGTSSAITLRNLTECAGKTGTTQDDGDRLFVGYTPDLVCGVWCGYAYPEPVVGRNICTGTWNAVMRRIFAVTGGRTEFEIPADVVRLSYCRDSGKLCGDACLCDPRGNRMASGWYVLGTEPDEVCDRHVLCAFAAPDGGILHGMDLPEDAHLYSLIRVERHFPVQVTVSDAQYVWRGAPALLAPNPKENEAYFESLLPDYCGRSDRQTPFNRSAHAAVLCSGTFFSDPGAGSPDRKSFVGGGVRFRAVS